MKTMLFTVISNIVLIVLLVLFMGGFYITFNPFSIGFERLTYMLGWIFLMVGAFLFYHSGQVEERENPEHKEVLIFLDEANTDIKERLVGLGYSTDDSISTEGNSFTVIQSNVFIMAREVIDLEKVREQYIVFDCGLDKELFFRLAEINYKNYED